MSKLRKSLKKSYSVFIKPSDEAIDWKKTAEKITEDVEYFSLIAELSFPGQPIEQVKKTFLDNAPKMAIYDYYVHKKFNSDIIVSKEDVPVLKYVFEDFNLTDLDILFSSADGLKSLYGSIKNQEITSANTVDLLLQVLENKELKDKVFELLKLVLNAKLVKCVGVDEGVSKEEVIEETIKELAIQDIKMLFKFIQSSIKLDVEKKNILES